MHTYICQFCKQFYQSDGERKPKSFRKDGSVYQYYDSTLFCSKECCNKYAGLQRSKLFKNDPEIMKKARQKQKETYIKHPEIKQEAKKKRAKTLEKHPEIIQKRIESFKKTLEEHPEIQQKMSESKREYYTISANRFKGVKKWRETKSQRNFQFSLAEYMKQNPQKREESYDKHYETMKKRSFTSKQEEHLFTLIKSKYPDAKQGYRDNRIQIRRVDGSMRRKKFDIYIPSLDLFIEYDGSRYHPNTEERKQKLLKEIEKWKINHPNEICNQYTCQAYNILYADTDEQVNKICEEKNLHLIRTPESIHYNSQTDYERFKILYDLNIL